MTSGAVIDMVDRQHNVQTSDTKSAGIRWAETPEHIGPSEEDELEDWWKIIIWVSLFIPCIGGWIIVVVSSIMYYVWRDRFPNKASQINRHGWAAWILGQVVAAAIYFALK